MTRFIATIGRDRFSFVDGVCFWSVGSLVATGQYWLAAGLYVGMFILSICGAVIAKRYDRK